MNYPKRKRRVPWHPNPNVAKRTRLKAKGLIEPQTKQQARTECAAAAKQFTVKRLPRRTRASIVIDKLICKSRG